MEGAPVLEVVDSPLDAEDAIRADQPLPDALPVLPLRETVTFPETLTPLAVGQERSIKLVDDVLGANRMLAMVAARDPEDEEPGPDDLYEVGVVGVVARMLKVPDGTLRILVQGTQRVRLGPYVAEQPYLVARIAELPDVVETSPELEALTRNVQRTFSEIVEQIPYLPEELQMAVANIEDPAALGHLIAGAAADLAPRRSRSCWRRSTSPSGCATSRRSSPASWRWSSSAPRSSPRCSRRSTKASASSSCASR